MGQVRDYIRTNWLTLGNFLLLLGLAFRWGAFTEEMRQNDVLNKQLISTIDKKVENHRNDIDKHMPFEKKIEVFVPRVELDSRLANMEKLLDKIDAKLSN